MKPKFKIIMLLVLALGLIWATGANAVFSVLNSNIPAGFEQAGYIQQATLDNPADPNSGGTLTLNGIIMIVPANSIIQMPANTLTWAQLFDPLESAPVYDSLIPPSPTPPINHPALHPITGLPMTGLALTDTPALPPAAGVFPGPFPAFNATVTGNIDVRNEKGFGAGAYIVGLILPVDQDLGNAGVGFITFIDYAKGRFEVGGTLGVQNTGTVIEINDPLGRFGLAHSPDPRWSVDADNPTVTTGNGYPMGLPKVAPAGGTLIPAAGEVGDLDRPYYNRPRNPGPANVNHDPLLQTGAPLQAFFMPASKAPNAAGVSRRDPWKQVPMMIGDYVSWAGVMMKNDPNAPLTPFNPALPVGPGNLPLNQQTYISANTVSADRLAVYTAPGTVAKVGPAYVSLERMVIGNGGAPVTVPPSPALGIQGGVIPLPEPKRNIVINGWCTDSTQLVDIFAVDIVNGVEQPRLLGTVLPEAGPVPGGKGNKGRFRFEIGKGNFLPATRMYRAQSHHGTVLVPNQTGNIVPPQGGLLSGQYSAPMFTFQFPAAAPGFPVIPNNFNIITFLTAGEGGNPSPGPLVPFPPFLP